MERGMSLYLAFPLLLLEFLSADACTSSISGSSSIVLKVGDRHTFSCSYSPCSSNKTISWRLNSVPQTTNVNVIYSTSIDSRNTTLHAGNASFTYTPSRPSSTSQNTVTVYCYVAGSRADSVSVNIQYGPKDAALNKTGTITLTEYDPTPYIACESTCNPACTFTFLRGGITRHTGVFFRPLVQRTDAGTYTCKASNRVGSKTSSMNFNLNVQYPPNFQLTRDPSSSQVEERSVVTFTFNPREGGNPTSYTFLQCNHTTLSGEFLRSISYRKTSSQVTFSLQNVSITDGGRYICAMTNNIPSRNGNTIVTASSVLQIKTPPIVLMDTKNVTLNGDGNWTLSVDFISLYYPPEIFWYKIVDDRTADYLENMDKKQKSHTMKKDNVSFSIPSYITSVKTKDPGKYLTFIKNSMGNAVVQYLVAVQVPEELSSDSGIALIAVGSVFLVLSALAIGMAAFLFYKTRKQKKAIRTLVRERHASLYIPPSIDVLSPTSIENDYREPDRELREPAREVREPAGAVNPDEVELEVPPEPPGGSKVIKPPTEKFKQQQNQLKDAVYENKAFSSKSTINKYTTIIPPENEQASFYETPMNLATGKKKGKSKEKKDSPYVNTKPDKKKTKETKHYANVNYKGGKTYENHQL